MSEFKGTKGERKIEFVYRRNSIALQVNAYPYPDRDKFKINLYEYILNADQCSAEGCSCLSEEMSNAKLIACAPEMLEILKDIDKYLEENRHINYTIEIMRREFYRKNQELIQKAIS